jgi:hypothetical protein
MTPEMNLCLIFIDYSHLTCLINVQIKSYVSYMYYNHNIISSYTLNNLQIHKGKYDVKDSLSYFYNLNFEVNSIILGWHY